MFLHIVCKAYLESLVSNLLLDSRLPSFFSLSLSFSLLAISSICYRLDFSASAIFCTKEKRKIYWTNFRGGALKTFGNIIWVTKYACHQQSKAVLKVWKKYTTELRECFENADFVITDHVCCTRTKPDQMEMFNTSLNETFFALISRFWSDWQAVCNYCKNIETRIRGRKPPIVVKCS